MAKYDIISKEGIVRASAEMEYSHTFMDIPKLTSRVTSAIPIPFAIDDYVEFRGVKYYLDTLPNSKQEKGFGSAGDSITYNLTLLGDERILDRYVMTDIVLNDNNVHYTGLPVFTAFCNPTALLQRILANLNIINADFGYEGDDKWALVVPEDSAELDIDGKDLSFSHETVWSVIKRLNSEFGLRFIGRGHKIYVYKDTYPFASPNTTFQYGRGNGLKDLSETISGDKIATRLKVYGGTKNLPLNYSDRIEIGATGLRYTPNLMIPDYFYSNGVIDYLEDVFAVQKFGIRYKSVVLDHIFPTIEKITVGDVLDNDNEKRIDEVDIVVADHLVGNDAVFKIWVTFPFDLNEYSEENNSRYFIQGTKVSFKDGWLGGYSFELLSVELVSPPYGYELTLKKIQNPDAGENNVAYLPDNVVKAQPGDHFILEDCFLPEALVKAAQNRLRKEGEELLKEESSIKSTYPLSLDSIYLANNPTDAELLQCGATIKFNYGVREDIVFIQDTIQQLTIKEGSGGLPQYSVVLSGKPILTKFGEIERNNIINAEKVADKAKRDNDIIRVQSEKKLNEQIGSKASIADLEVLRKEIKPVYFDFSHTTTQEGEVTQDIEIVDANEIEFALRQLDSGRIPFARISNNQKVEFSSFESEGSIIPIEIASWNNDSEYLRAVVEFDYNNRKYTITVDQELEPVVSLTYSENSNGGNGGTITSDRIGSRAVTSDKIALEAVLTEHIKPHAITEECISTELQEKINADNTTKLWKF